MKIKIDKEKCIGCGLCASTCPEVFEMKNGKAVVKSSGNAKCTKKAAEECPVNAITVS